MKSSPALARVLMQLLEAGSLPLSKVSGRVQEDLKGLVDADVLAVARQGAGRRYVVLQEIALQGVAERLFPEGLDAALTLAQSRREAVRNRRDAKAARAADTEAVLLRGMPGAVFRRGDEVLKIGEWTLRAGYAAMELGAGEAWGFQGLVVVVENLEPFRWVEDVVPALRAEGGLAVYAGGRISGRLLGWLAKLAGEGCRVLHWGDYDPVGMDEFLRLKKACGGRAELVLPEGLEGLFRGYAKAELLTGNAAVLARLRGCGDDEVERVVGLMDRFGGGLEQEAGIL